MARIEDKKSSGSVLLGEKSYHLVNLPIKLVTRPLMYLYIQ